MSKTAAKIYYLPLPESGKFEEVPTVEYQLPDDRCWQEKLMDVIGWAVVCVAIGGSVSTVFIQIVMWIWGHGNL